VYGGAADADVLIAKEIAAGERIPINHIDKSMLRPVTADSLPAMVRRNYHTEDGYPNFGILGTDAEYFARLQRTQGPAIVMTGAAGEIFRNAFKLDVDSEFCSLCVHEIQSEDLALANHSDTL
jgi:hypothetical protein